MSRSAPRRPELTPLPPAHSGVGVFAEIGLLLLSVVLFSLSFPSALSQGGWFPLAYVALVPLFVAVRSASWLRCLLYGPLVGFLSYAVYNYWLTAFHPITIFVVPPIHAVYYLGLFPLLKLGDTLFPRSGYVVQTLTWVAYEYLKIQGFLGYPWGVMGYTQYLFVPFIGVARLGGVWAVSLYVVFSSALLAAALARWRERPPQLRGPSESQFAATAPVERLRPLLVPAVLYVAAFVAALAYGFVSRVDTTGDPTRRFALIQQNADPWKTEYAKTLDALIRLSDEALAQAPDIVVWSETSFVPAIDWHRRYRTEREKYELVRRLEEYLVDKRVPFVIGNDDGQLRRDPQGQEVRVDYNAALLVDGGVFPQTYRKLRLVPFTEHFPFERVLPGIYDFLATNPDIHFWERGEEATVFEAAGIRFSTPICFEDSFGYLSREFVRRGAGVIVNLTNDAWSKSVTAEMQHMSMAVFRAVENARSVVRSTNGGMTVSIDPNGRILEVLEPFVESFLVADVSIHTASRTLYTAWGDWLGIGALVSAAALLLFGVARAARRRALGLTRGGG